MMTSADVENRTKEIVQFNRVSPCTYNWVPTTGTLLYRITAGEREEFQ